MKERREKFLTYNPDIKQMLNFDRDLINIASADYLTQIRDTLDNVQTKRCVSLSEITFNLPETKTDFYKMFLYMVINGLDTYEIVYNNCSKNKIKNLAYISQDAFQDLNTIYPEFFVFFEAVEIGVLSQTIGFTQNGKLTFTLKGNTLDRISETIKAASFVINCLRSSNKINDYMTDYEKVQVIFQWVVLHAKYSKKTKTDFNTFGFFFNGTAVCQAFTGAFNLLCKMENIPAIGVYGNLKNSKNHSNHIWSFVKIDNRFTYIDCTVGSPIFSNRNILLENGIIPEELCNWEGFDLSEKKLKETHSWGNYYFENLLINNSLCK